MNDLQRKMARHALGLDGDRKRSYRNRYFTVLNGSHEDEWNELCRRGLAKREEGSGSLINFYLTNEGALLALDEGEILDPEDFEDTIRDPRRRQPMTERRLMYVCSECADENPEGCGHFDRKDLRVLPDGKWLCEGCFEETTQRDRGNADEDVYLDWSDMPAPPEYGPPSPAVLDRDELREGIFACAASTLCGFENELTQRQIQFICQQIADKAALDYPDGFKGRVGGARE